MGHRGDRADLECSAATTYVPSRLNRAPSAAPHCQGGADRHTQLKLEFAAKLRRAASSALNALTALLPTRRRCATRHARR